MKVGELIELLQSASRDAEARAAYDGDNLNENANAIEGVTEIHDLKTGTKTVVIRME